MRPDPRPLALAWPDPCDFTLAGSRRTWAATASAAALTPSALGGYLRDPWEPTHTLAGQLPVWGPFAGPVFALLIAAVLAWARRARRRYQHRLHDGAQLVTVLVPPTVDPDGAETLWANLAGLAQSGWRRLLTGQPHVAWEYLFDADGIRIQLWVPGGVPHGLVERAVEAAWPGARATAERPHPPLPTFALPGRRLLSAGGELRLARTETLPIRSDHRTDPLRALLAAPLGLTRDQRAAVQILARPVAGRRPARHTRPVVLRLLSRLLDLLLDLLTPSTHGRGAQAHQNGSPADHQNRLRQASENRAALPKNRGPRYETRIRYAVLTTVPYTTADPGADAGPRSLASDEAARKAQGQIQGRARAIAAAFTGYSDHNHYRRARLRDPLHALARRRLRRGDLLSVAELAALAHLPLDLAAPGLQRAGAKAVPPPPAIPTRGRDIRPIGLADSGQRRRPVGLHVADARHHVHVLGAPGAGKSELLARMTLADVHAGRGVVNVDPKGDQINDILARLPLAAAHRVVLFDAETSTQPPCLNPLDQPDRHRAADNLTSIFSRIYADSWGPRTDDILRASLLTLAAGPGTPRLTDLPKLLESPAFRARALRAVDDEILLGFWQWYDQLTDGARAFAVAPLMNKLRGLLLRPFIRHTLAAGPSTVQIDDVLDHGGICLVRAAQDTLGVETAALLGSIVVSTVWQSVTRRARLSQHHRADAALYLDEAHYFLTLPYALDDMLTAARAYRLSITLAHQHLAQLPRHLEEAIATNARNKVFFAVSPTDARRLVGHVEPRLNEHDLAHLDVFHVAARLVVAGANTAPFTARTEPLPPAIPGRADQIRAIAHRRATRPTEPDRRRPRPAA
ncbi:TraM recognition domain-containing protein [Frankia sp. CNm7]|uniref:TraM recognition domain-containing protein n=1 Tax=Frankia nepalensis TaxID=1836974 RepID=UPI001931558E|nr:TraM recognition domain-containing protein [Frankia nepalensis]MBL7520631.1 TraM recognition domain-containing protein [Frankia nepalensis]